uniref:Uncharacterized protein n=1 Tax=Romanomermis culicivorax TaxID=13658 RepID=A0A915JT07_ROMCU
MVRPTAVADAIRRWWGWAATRSLRRRTDDGKNAVRRHCCCVEQRFDWWNVPTAVDSRKPPEMKKRLLEKKIFFFNDPNILEQTVLSFISTKKRAVFGGLHTGSNFTNFCRSGPAFRIVVLLPWDCEYSRGETGGATFISAGKLNKDEEDCRCETSKLASILPLLLDAADWSVIC